MESLFIFAIGCSVGYYIFLLATDKKGSKKSAISKTTEAKKPTKTETSVGSLRKEVSWAQPNRKNVPIADKKEASGPETTPAPESKSPFKEPSVTPEEPSTEPVAETSEIDSKFKKPFTFDFHLPLNEDETGDPLKELCIRSLQKMEGEVPVNEFVSAIHRADRLIRELQELLESSSGQELPSSIFDQIKAIGEKIEATSVAHLCVDRLTEIGITVQVERPELESEFSGAFVEVNRMFA